MGLYDVITIDHPALAPEYRDIDFQTSDLYETLSNYKVSDTGILSKKHPEESELIKGQPRWIREDFTGTTRLVGNFIDACVRQFVDLTLVFKSGKLVYLDVRHESPMPYQKRWLEKQAGSKSPTLIDLQRVINFARLNGFPHAGMGCWDDDCPEYGNVEFASIADEYDEGDEVKVGVGIFLNRNVVLKVEEDGFKVVEEGNDDAR